MNPFLSIRGGNPLCGEVPIGGMKNAALPILFATILIRGKTVIENLPPVTDVEITLQILESMGAIVRRENATTVQIDATHADPDAIPLGLTTRLRATSYLLGAGLGRFGRICIGIPGGCDFGNRPLDQHFKLFSALGAESHVCSDCIAVSSRHGLCGATVRLDFPSVGATVNGILAAVTATGTTVIDNAAREPHIVDLAAFLNACGAEIDGAGTSRICIRGGKALHSCRHRVVPDMIEAGTYLAAVAGTGGKLRVCSVVPDHLDAVIDKLTTMGVSVQIESDRITAMRNKPLCGTEIQALPYPGFPTDMQPQFAPLLCLATGGGRICECVWDDRFRYAQELRRMGATIAVNGHCATFRGNDRLVGTQVSATDLRAGAAMLIAGLCAEGTTTISQLHHIERGYPDFLNKFRNVGAEISRFC